MHHLVMSFFPIERVHSFYKLVQELVINPFYQPLENGKKNNNTVFGLSKLSLKGASYHSGYIHLASQCFVSFGFFLVPKQQHIF